MDLSYPNTLGNLAIRSIFINQLSILYSAKNHLIDNLPTLINNSNFNTLKLALSEQLDDTHTQMISLKTIFKSLNESALKDYCIGMNAIIKEALDQVQDDKSYRYESDMSIIFYMGVIEHLQVGASKILNLLALRPELREYAQLVTECLDIAKDNSKLFLLVAEEYLQAVN
ncbi:DUF892 family protein [Mucilaginibacter lappiensis]|uniref:Ferritin-like metal-binding protein YciE n=1 Tax=Mucilaginibacter lappiensis TaxID=354630 RepID=A0A1N7EVG2_9SPHI|nr:DUF892 family protein [Mucilaginibacter lappiensis]MBB6112020.1 ferritin-like metal-binding protein YciE [Mucilaginibacter lappiensis]MBB6126462.1 ferritin-like metal-binding protein YciE [Mucilaginibacter lappiensis]SIR92101.1 Ferritin-like metal-binding protein YciE [Mucilaginibacter lappiensis]